MIVTPFGDLEYGDASGLDDWLAAHSIRHRVERQAINLQKGIPLSPQAVDAPVDAAWMGRHMIIHVALMRFFRPDETVGAVPLEMPWSSVDNFYYWHQLHNRLHSRIDQALGIQ